MTFGLLASCMLTPPVCVRRLQPQLLCFLIDDGDVVDLAAAGTTWDRGAQRGRLSELECSSVREKPLLGFPLHRCSVCCSAGARDCDGAVHCGGFWVCGGDVIRFSIWVLLGGFLGWV